MGNLIAKHHPEATLSVCVVELGGQEVEQKRGQNVGQKLGQNVLQNLGQKVSQNVDP